MSFTFTLDGFDGPAPTLAALQAAAGGEIGAEEAVDAGAPLAGLVHLFRPGSSTRSTEVEANDGQLTVRILACASLEDHQLALALVRGAAADLGLATVVAEDGDDPVDVDDLETYYGPDWAADQLAAGIAAVVRTVDANPGKIVTLAGPVRAFSIGDRLLGELRDGGPPEALADRLIGAIRRTQWPGDCHVASLIQVEGGPSGRSVRLAVLSGGARTLLPDVDAIALRAGDTQIYVRPAALADILGERVHRLDERHLLVDALDDGDWHDLLRRATLFAQDLDDL